MGRIAKITELIVPVMAALYIVGALIVIIFNFKEIPYAFHAIIVGALRLLLLLAALPEQR